MKKLLSRIAEVLGIKNGCSADFEEAVVVIFSSRNSFFGVTCRAPLPSLQSYRTNWPLAVISSSDFCAELEFSDSCNCDLTMLMPFSWCTLEFSVTTRWPLTKTPNDPESTVWLDAAFALSFLSPT